MNISLRRFIIDDWQLFKAIRLEALKMEPHFFGSNYARETAFVDGEWQLRLSNPHSGFWGLYDGEECIGLTGIISNNSELTEARLIASYIRKQYRGLGLSALYYKERIRWAKEYGYKTLYVAHRKSNLASKAANQKFGFEYLSSTMIDWPDGTKDEDVVYRLTL